VLDADETVWDQNAFNDIFRRVVKTDDSRSDRLFWWAPVRCQKVHTACRRAVSRAACQQLSVQPQCMQCLQPGCVSAVQGVDWQPTCCHPAAGAVVQHACLSPGGVVCLMPIGMMLSTTPRKRCLLPGSAGSLSVPRGQPAPARVPRRAHEGFFKVKVARRRVYDGSLRMGILPVALFAGGHTFFAQRMAERAGREPYAVHATFQFSGTPGKRHRFRERMARPLPRPRACQRGSW